MYIETFLSVNLEVTTVYLIEDATVVFQWEDSSGELELLRLKKKKKVRSKTDRKARPTTKPFFLDCFLIQINQISFSQ